MGIFFLTLVLLGVCIGSAAALLTKDLSVRHAVLCGLYSAIGTVGTALFLATLTTPASIDFTPITFLSVALGGAAVLTVTIYLSRA